MGLDSEKEYRQCRCCENIYDLEDLVEKGFTQEEIEHAYRAGDYIQGQKPIRKEMSKFIQVKEFKSSGQRNVKILKAFLRFLNEQLDRQAQKKPVQPRWIINYVYICLNDKEFTIKELIWVAEVNSYFVFLILFQNNILSVS